MASMPYTNYQNLSSLRENRPRDTFEVLYSNDISTNQYTRVHKTQNSVSEKQHNVQSERNDPHRNVYAPLEENGMENPYETVPLSKQVELINLKTHEKTRRNPFGVNALEEYCFPVKFYDLSPTDIVEKVNKGDIATVVELIKHVHAVIIPKSTSQIDLLTLSILLGCCNKGIESRIAREIQNILFQTEVRRQSLDTLLKSVEVMLGVVRTRAISPDTLKNILPNVILMLTVVHHVLLDQANRHTLAQEIRLKTSEYTRLLDEIEYPITSEVDLNMLSATKTLISGLNKVVSSSKANRLQLGSWANELRKDSCLKKISDGLCNMSQFEHYSLVARLLIEMNLAVGEKQVNFLNTVLRYIKRKATKAESRFLHPLFVVAFRGIGTILSNYTHQDIQRDDKQSSMNATMCDVLKMCIESSKISDECKKSLQEDLVELLFHKNETVALEISNLLKEKGRFCLADYILPYLHKILEPLSFNVFSETKNVEQTSPRWHEIHGLIVGYKEVSVHVHAPVEILCSQQVEQRTMMDDTEAILQNNSLNALRSLLNKYPHPNIKKLIAFQVDPLPQFFMTEKLADATLSTILLRERKHRCWISPRKLGLIVIDCLQAIVFLHQRKMVHRDITASSFNRRDEQTYVLSDFSITKTVDVSECSMQDIEVSQIPTRWSSPESLIDDLYDFKSDVWMLGHLIYEIFIHGGHPFTEMYSCPTDDLMEMVVFHDLKPHRWPCIPLPVHKIILQCVETKPSDRITAEQILQNMQLWMRSLDDMEEEQEVEQISIFNNRGSGYPELDQRQKDPERGSTRQLRQLKNMRGDPRVSYYNRASKRRLASYSKKTCIQANELSAPDHPSIKEKGMFLEVEEPVTHNFLRTTFPKLSSQKDFGEVQHIVRFPPDRHERDSTNKKGLTHALVYRCKKADSLLDIAKTCKYGDPEDRNNEMSYLEVIFEAVQFVEWMHRNGWILRDLCCSILFRAQYDDKVFMPRLGRMMKIQERTSRNEAYIIDKTTCIDDRRNWSPAEVIAHGHFSQSSDIYMLAMTIQEFYSYACLGKKPVFNPLEAVPFSNTEPSKLLDLLRHGEIPQEPDACPVWLFTLMKKCWNRDPTQRPTAKDLLTEISKRLTFSDDSTFDSVSSDNTSLSSCSARSRKSNIEASEETCQLEPADEEIRPVPPPRRKRNNNPSQIPPKQVIINTTESDGAKEIVGALPSTKIYIRPKISHSQADLITTNPPSSISRPRSLSPPFYPAPPPPTSNNDSSKTLIREQKSEEQNMSNQIKWEMPKQTAFQDDSVGYLDFDPSKPNSEMNRCVTWPKKTISNRPPAKIPSAYQPKNEIRPKQTAFADDSPGYLDFDTYLPMKRCVTLKKGIENRPPAKIQSGNKNKTICNRSVHRDNITILHRETRPAGCDHRNMKDIPPPNIDCRGNDSPNRESNCMGNPCENNSPRHDFAEGANTNDRKQLDQSPNLRASHCNMFSERLHNCLGAHKRENGFLPNNAHCNEVQNFAADSNFSDKCDDPDYDYPDVNPLTPYAKALAIRMNTKHSCEAHQTTHAWTAPSRQWSCANSSDCSDLTLSCGNSAESSEETQSCANSSVDSYQTCSCANTSESSRECPACSQICLNSCACRSTDYSCYSDFEENDGYIAPTRILKNLPDAEYVNINKSHGRTDETQILYENSYFESYEDGKTPKY